MRVVLVTEPGSVPVLAERDRPAPVEGDVSIAVLAAPITPLDLLCASGTSYFGRPETPYVPGVQGVGVVEQAPPGLAPGTMVWFATAAGMRPGDGSMRDHVVVPPSDVVALPGDVDPVAIAGLGLSAVAAWMTLTWRGGLVPGESVLVLGAGGVVGQSAIQLARRAGAARVFGAARSERARQRALELGADAVASLAGPADVDQIADRLNAACDTPVDLVIDPVFGTPAAAALRVLRPGGRLVNLGGSAGDGAVLSSATIRSNSLRILGYTNNELSQSERRDALLVVAAESIAGRLQIDLSPTPFVQVQSAWQGQAAGDTTRRSVLTM